MSPDEVRMTGIVNLNEYGIVGEPKEIDLENRSLATLIEAAGWVLFEGGFALVENKRFEVVGLLPRHLFFSRQGLGA